MQSRLGGGRGGSRESRGKADVVVQAKVMAAGIKVEVVRPVDSGCVLNVEETGLIESNDKRRFRC